MVGGSGVSGWFVMVVIAWFVCAFGCGCVFVPVDLCWFVVCWFVFVGLRLRVGLWFSGVSDAVVVWAFWYALLDVCWAL